MGFDRDVIRKAAEVAGLPLDDARVEVLAPLLDELARRLEELRRFDPDGVDQLEPAFGFLSSAWINRPH